MNLVTVPGSLTLVSTRKHHRLLLALGCLGAAALGSATVRTQIIEYRHGDALLQGYLAYDDVLSGKRPAVLIVHDWDGLTPYEESRAQQLAALGYVAFAVDVYGKGNRPTNREESGKRAGKYRTDRPLFRARLRAALDELMGNQRVDATRVAAIGYCFGGTGVLELARSGAPVRGVVSFHGGLANPTPGDAKNIKGSVLVLHGAADPGVPPAEVEAFRKEMEDAKADYQIVAYGGAVHAFTVPSAGSNPARGAAYDGKADLRSWEAMRDFFREIFER